MGYNLSVAQYGLQLEKITLKMNSRWRVIFGTVGRLVGTSTKEKAFHLKKKKKEEKKKKKDYKKVLLLERHYQVNISNGLFITLHATIS